MNIVAALLIGLASAGTIRTQSFSDTNCATSLGPATSADVTDRVSCADWLSNYNTANSSNCQFDQCCPVAGVTGVMYSCVTDTPGGGGGNSSAANGTKLSILGIAVLLGALMA